MAVNLPSGVASGFFPNEVVGCLRPTATIVQWNIAAPDPSGRRHVESGSYRKTAHLQYVGGFTAQMESGVALDFGNIAIPGAGSGFTTDTIAITFNMSEANSHPDSRFDILFDNGSGTASEDHTAFNFRMWIGNLSAFDAVAHSGVNKDPVQISPVFHFRESAQWRQGFNLTLTEPSGGPGSGAPFIGISGVSIVPSGMPDCPNVFTRGKDITASGAFLDREFTNFVYIKGFFPTLPSGTFYQLGTYGGLGQKNFRLKFSYDYTRKDANIIDPTDTKDFPISVVKGFPPQTLGDVSGWWQGNESSPKLSRASGFSVDDGFTFGQTTMTQDEFREGGGNIGRASGVVSSGSASGFAINCGSSRRDVIRTTNTDPVTMVFDGADSDGNTGFTFTGWIALNDPSGVDPAATGVGARIPSLDTGVLCRWNFRFALQSLQYRCWFARSISRFVWQIRTKDFRSTFMPYNYMAVDDAENGLGALGGGVQTHRWYFLSFGYDPAGDGAAGGDIFFRVNDGPIDRSSFASDQQSLIVTGGTADPPFALCSHFTRTAGNGSLGPGAGQYDNWTLHRRALTNREMLDLYNGGFGQEFPVGDNRILDFSLPPELAIIDVDPDPVPLRRGLRAFYNFSEASGALAVADSQRYTDLAPDNSQAVSGAISGQFIPTSGIIVDSMPVFNDLASASGALQIRKSGGIGFEDGQIGNNVWWEAGTNSQMSAIGDCEFTFACWVRFPRSGFTEDIAANWTATGNNRFWIIVKDSADNVLFARANGTTIGQPPTMSTPSEFATDFVAGRWYFIFITSEATGGIGSSSMTWSLNVHDPILGVTHTTIQINTFQWGDLNAVPITFGASETLATARVADIDFGSFGLWRRKLTANEILSLINSGNGLNFGAGNFGKISRVYWDSQLKRENDPSTI